MRIASPYFRMDWTTDVWPADWGPKRAVGTDGFEAQ